MPFLNDRILWYNPPGSAWGQLGYAVPNVGDNLTTINSTVKQLVDVIGRNVFTMAHCEDARLRTPPIINTVTNIHRLCVRVRDILAARMVPSSQARMQATHSTPATDNFLLFPAPYFKMQNAWLKGWCQLAFYAISEAAQHTENARSFGISPDFAGTVGQYFNAIYIQLAVELLQVPRADAEAPGFTLSDAQLQAYDPAKFFTRTELVDVAPPSYLIPTEDDLAVLSAGIPAVLCTPFLSPYPMGRVETPADAAANSNASILGGTGTGTSGGANTSFVSPNP